MAKYKAIWLDKNLERALENFIVKNFRLKPDLVITEVGKQAIKFAISRPKEFVEFLVVSEGKR